MVWRSYYFLLFSEFVRFLTFPFGSCCLPLSFAGINLSPIVWPCTLLDFRPLPWSSSASVRSRGTRLILRTSWFLGSCRQKETTSCLQGSWWQSTSNTGLLMLATCGASSPSLPHLMRVRRPTPPFSWKRLVVLRLL